MFISEYSNIPVVSEWNKKGIKQFVPLIEHPVQSQAPLFKAVFIIDDKS